MIVPFTVVVPRGAVSVRAFAEFVENPLAVSCEWHNMLVLALDTGIWSSNATNPKTVVNGTTV